MYVRKWHNTRAFSETSIDEHSIEKKLQQKILLHLERELHILQNKYVISALPYPSHSA